MKIKITMLVLASLSIASASSFDGVSSSGGTRGFMGEQIKMLKYLGEHLNKNFGHARLKSIEETTFGHFDVETRERNLVFDPPTDLPVSPASVCVLRKYMLVSEIVDDEAEGYIYKVINDGKLYRCKNR